jgi:DNA-binding LacI/PurR family transcriptional regulator
MKKKQDRCILKSKKSLWAEVLEQVTRAISQGEFKRGDKFYSITELAKKYKVSNITCRRVISELASRGLIECIPNKGSFIKSTLLKREINLFSSFETSIESRIDKSIIYSELYKGIVREADKLHFSLKTVSKKYLETCPPSNDTTMLLLLEHLPEDKELLNLVTGKNKICVCCHSIGKSEKISTVRSNYTKGVHAIISHLLSLGHKRIAFISCELESRWVPSRFDGYYKALVDNDIQIDFSLVKAIHETDQKSINMAIDDLLKLKCPPTAIFAANDGRALQILEYCKAKGIRVPEELSVVGFDNLPETAVSSPPLTTIDNFWEEQGREAIRMFLELSENPSQKVKDVMIEPKLIIRKSTKTLNCK